MAGPWQPPDRVRFPDPDYSVPPGIWRGRTWDVCRGKWVEAQYLSECHWRYLEGLLTDRDRLELVRDRHPGTPRPPAETPVPPVTTPSPAPTPPTPTVPSDPLPPSIGGGRDLPPPVREVVPPSLVSSFANVWPASRRDVAGGTGEKEKKPCWVCILVALAALWALTQGCAVRLAHSEELEISHPTLELRVPRAPAAPNPAVADTARHHAADCETFTVRRP